MLQWSWIFPLHPRLPNYFHLLTNTITLPSKIFQSQWDLIVSKFAVLVANCSWVLWGRSRYRILILARASPEVLLVTLLQPPYTPAPPPTPPSFSPLHPGATISPIPLIWVKSASLPKTYLLLNITVAKTFFYIFTSILDSLWVYYITIWFCSSSSSTTTTTSSSSWSSWWWWLWWWWPWWWLMMVDLCVPHWAIAA